MACGAALIVALVAWLAVLSGWLGWATYYAPGVFQQVLSNRNLPPCATCTGYAAMDDPQYLGRRVWVRNLASGEWAGPLLVADCAKEEDRPRLAAMGHVVELDYDLALAWGMQGPIEVEVRLAPPAKRGRGPLP